MIPPGWLIGQNGRQQVSSKARTLRLVAASLFLFFVLTLISSWYGPVVHNLAGNVTPSLLKRPERYLTKWHQDQSASLINLMTATQPPIRSPLPTIQVWVDHNEFLSLNRSILQYGFGGMEKKPRVKGFSQLADGSLLPVSISYRGTNSWHHQVWRPSLRLRYKKNFLAGGYRNHMLSAPEDPLGMRNWVSDQLAQRFGLLTYQEHFVRLYVNRNFLGHYSRTWRLDESLLIQQGRLPGPIYRLESGTGPVFVREKTDLWDAASWDINGEDTTTGRDAIQRLLSIAAYPTNPANNQILKDLMDQKQTAKWLAVLAHSGSNHVESHNLAFWLDPVTGRFVPLPVDFSGYGWLRGKADLDRPLIMYRNPLVFRWLADPENLAAAMDQLFLLMNGPGKTETMEVMVREAWSELRQDAMADSFASEMGVRNILFVRSLFPLTQMENQLEQLVDFIHQRDRFINQQLQADSLEIIQQNDQGFELLLVGSVGCTVERVDGQPISFPANRDHAKRWDLLPAVPDVNLDGFAESGIDTATLSFPAYGFFNLPGQPQQYIFKHRHSKEPLPFQTSSEEHKKTVRAVAGQSRVRPHVKKTMDPVIIGPGTITLSESKIYSKNQPVSIVAGTELNLGPGVSLLFKGPVKILGEQNQPVVISPEDPKKGFGVVALVGGGTKGSVISHLDMSGGSIGTYLNLQFLGMFSVHDCPDLVVEHSTFSGNVAGDDTVHVIRSKADFFHCTFKNSLSDAMDWDKVEGSIIGSTFSNCGNDCLDLSMGKVRVEGCVITGAGDKGISAGEGVKLVVQSTAIINSDIGLAAKDTAQVNLEYVQIHGCRLGFAGYMKKWRWGAGGIAWFEEVTITDSGEADIQGDKRSLIYLPWLQTKQLSRQGKINLLPWTGQPRQN